MKSPEFIPMQEPPGTPLGAPPPRFAAPPPPYFAVPPPPFMPSQPRRKRRRWPFFVAILGVLVFFGAVAIGALAFKRDGPSYPSQWDTRVAPLAAKVEQLRGLTFKHPVEVKYLSVSDFEKEVTSSPEDLKKVQKEIDQTTGLLRAAGLIGGKVDLGKAANDTQAADTIAFYDPDSKEVFVRGDGAFTIETRVTLAHELTHVLQDQHFDLPKLQKQADDSKTGSSDALTALIEGDAMHVEDLYLADQTAAERKEYDRLSNATSDTASDRTKDVPAVIQTLFGAPYIFGPQIISVLDSSGGNTAINDALTGPTPTTRIYLDPTALDDTNTAPPVPKLEAGEKKMSTGSDNDDEFDDFTLYLMLGAHVDTPSALRAADAFSAGSEVLYTKAGKTCFRAAIDGTSPRAVGFIGGVLQRWTKAMPDAAVDSTDGVVVFHSCDPGKGAAAPSTAAIKQTTSYAVNRAALTSELVTKQHATTELATCAARLFFQTPSLRASVFGTLTESPDRLRQEGAAVGLACRRDPTTGLP